MDKILEAKMQELVDRHDIWSVVLRYARGIDRMDREMLRSCYWDDAIDDHYAYIGGPDYFIDTTFAAAKAMSHVQHHGVSNHNCELDGDNAYAETYYTFIGANIEPPHLLSMALSRPFSAARRRVEVRQPRDSDRKELRADRISGRCPDPPGRYQRRTIAAQHA
jgi:hypothetical protein